MFSAVSRPFGIRVLVSAALLGVSSAILADDDDDKRLRAVPFAFVGTAAQCGGPAGSNIVTSAWLGGMGLPDNEGQKPNKPDRRFGLLLSKNGPTANCSSAGAEIRGAKGLVVDHMFELGYDYRNGGHCGAGAPRFNVDTDMGRFFVGCANAPQSQAPQDPAEWRRTRSSLTTCGAECFPSPVPNGARIRSLVLIYDEGTDTPSNDTEGVGLAVVDNIFVNGKFIRSGRGIEPKSGERDDD